MDERIKNVRKWIKEHKKEIVITGVISIVSAISGIVLYEKFGRTKATDWYLPVPDISPGNERYHGGGTQVAIYDDVFPLAAMGILGERIAESIPNLPDSPNVVYAEIVMEK